MENRGKYPAMAVFFVFMAALLVITPVSAHAFSSKKYASLVIDANSGKVLHAENASRKRHPASLTKMMTLYLTFDALRTGKLRMNTTLRASKKAASMPSTNLHMKKGSRITVRDAIKALIVRSANDVAVILAEKIAGSEYKFAKQMTAVARRLGMKNTTFKNASGLPNRKQVTTARDLAVLSLALRRHYPEYYPLFRTQSFKYKGKKYKGHNRAMSRIRGADGLKTGYIRASGFNLVTSATRRNGSVIGVVLGGDTSKERDDKMVSLVEHTFARMNLQNNRRQFVLYDDPVPIAKPRELVVLAQKKAKQASKTVNLAAKSKHVKQYPAYQIAETTNAKQKQYVSFSSNVDKKSKQFVQFSAYDEDMKQNNKSRGQFMPVNYHSTSGERVYKVKPTKEWGVQVGAYEESREAMVAAANAVSFAPNLLRDARINVTDKHKSKGKVLYRARLADMTKTSAKKACNILEAMKTPCFVYRDKKNSSI